MRARKPSRAAIIGVGTAALIAVVGGAVGAVVATGGHAPKQPAAVRLVQRSSTAAPTTTTTAPAPTTTTTTPSATAATPATNAGTSGPTTTTSTASTGSTTSTTTTTTAPPATTTTTTLPACVDVPNVVGMTESAATSALKALGYGVQAGPALATATSVVDLQSPLAGWCVPTDEVVSIT